MQLGHSHIGVQFQSFCFVDDKSAAMNKWVCFSNSSAMVSTFAMKASKGLSGRCRARLRECKFYSTPQFTYQRLSDLKIIFLYNLLLWKAFFSSWFGYIGLSKKKQITTHLISVIFTWKYNFICKKKKKKKVWVKKL